MPAFKFTQKKIVTMTGTFEADVPEDMTPAEWLKKEREIEDPLHWETLEEAHLSLDVEPVPSKDSSQSGE